MYPHNILNIYTPWRQSEVDKRDFSRYLWSIVRVGQLGGDVKPIYKTANTVLLRTSHMKKISPQCDLCTVAMETDDHLLEIVVVWYDRVSKLDHSATSLLECLL